MTDKPESTAAAVAAEASQTVAIIAGLRRRLRDQLILRHPAVMRELHRLDIQLIGQMSGTGSRSGRHRSGVYRASADAAQVEDIAGFDLKPDPLTATTPAQFIAALREYRAWSGSPSWRKMAERAGQAVVHSTMHAAMHSDALPKLDVVKAIIVGCNGGPEDVRAFVTAWRQLDSHRTQAMRDGTGLLPAPVAELSLSSS
jgi:hypothetical protein